MTDHLDMKILFINILCILASYWTTAYHVIVMKFGSLLVGLWCKKDGAFSLEFWETCFVNSRLPLFRVNKTCVKCIIIISIEHLRYANF